MKSNLKYAVLLLTALLLFGCVQQAEQSGLANPASEFCIANNGTLELIEGTGYCHLPGGAVCEEWAFYHGSCPSATPEPSVEPVTCGIYSLGDSWPAGDDCNTCSCTKTGIVCTLMACEPTPSPKATPSPEPTGVESFKGGLEASLNSQFNTTAIEFESEYYGYFERWTTEYQDELWPEPYSFEIRNKNDYRLGYGRERSSNGVSVSWDSRGSTDVHWLEFKCGEYQFWSKTNLIHDLEFYEFMDACTNGCQEK